MSPLIQTDNIQHSFNVISHFRQHCHCIAWAHRNALAFGGQANPIRYFSGCNRFIEQHTKPSPFISVAIGSHTCRPFARSHILARPFVFMHSPSHESPSTFHIIQHIIWSGSPANFAFSGHFARIYTLTNIANSIFIDVQRSFLFWPISASSSGIVYASTNGQWPMYGFVCVCGCAFHEAADLWSRLLNAIAIEIQSVNFQCERSLQHKEWMEHIAFARRKGWNYADSCSLSEAEQKWPAPTRCKIMPVK